MNILIWLNLTIASVLVRRGYGIPTSGEIGDWQKGSLLDGRIVHDGLCAVKKPSVSLKEGRIVLVILDPESSCSFDALKIFINPTEIIVDGVGHMNHFSSNYTLVFQRVGNVLFAALDTAEHDSSGSKVLRVSYNVPLDPNVGKYLDIDCMDSLGNFPVVYSNECGSSAIVPWGDCKRDAQKGMCEHSQHKTIGDQDINRKCSPHTCVESGFDKPDNRSFDNIACNLENTAPAPEARKHWITTFTCQDTESCRKRCADNMVCKFFSFSDRACSHFNEVLSGDLLISINGSTCGVRECHSCMQLGKPKTSSAIYRNLSDVKFYTACEAFCESDPSCLMWSYHRSSGKCSLFSSKVEIAPDGDSLTSSFDCGSPQCFIKGLGISLLPSNHRFSEQPSSCSNMSSALSCRICCLEDSVSVFFSYDLSSKHCKCYRTEPHGADMRSSFNENTAVTSGRVYCPLSNRSGAKLPDNFETDGRADCIYEGMYFKSNNVMIAPSIYRCINLAKKNGMKFFSFSPPEKACSLLTDAPDSSMVPYYSSDAVSGFVECMTDPEAEMGFNAINCIEPSMKITGFGDKNKADTFMNCHEICSHSPGPCRFWSFDYDTKYCYLFKITPTIFTSITYDNPDCKNYDAARVPRIEKNDRWVSGRGNCGSPDCYFRHIEFTDMKILPIFKPILDVFQCQEHCLSTAPVCKSWTFYKGTCHHFGNLPEPENVKKRIGSYAGKPCEPIDNKFMGKNIPCDLPARWYEDLNKAGSVNHKPNILQIGLCRDECRADDKCKFFTLLIEGERKGCYLSGSVITNQSKYIWDDNSFTGSALCEPDAHDSLAYTTSDIMTYTLGYDYQIDSDSYYLTGKTNNNSYQQCAYDCESTDCHLWTAHTDGDGVQCKFYMKTNPESDPKKSVKPIKVIAGNNGVINSAFGVKTFFGYKSVKPMKIQMFLPGMRLGGNTSTLTVLSFGECLRRSVSQKQAFTYEIAYSRCYLFPISFDLVPRVSNQRSNMMNQTYIWSDYRYISGMQRDTLHTNTTIVS